MNRSGAPVIRALLALPIMESFQLSIMPIVDP